MATLAPQEVLNQNQSAFYAVAHSAFLADIHTRFDLILKGFFAKQGLQREQVEDLTQEVYLRLARRPELTSIENIKAFVFATARNLLRDRFRRKKTRGIQLDIESEEQVATESADPVEALEFTQILDKAMQVLGTLKPATQRVFLMHRINGLSHSEIALTLGVSASLIEKHMISAIAALRTVNTA